MPTAPHKQPHQTQWEKVKLGDIAEIKNGSTPSTTESNNFGGDIVWITPKDLSNQKSKYIYTSNSKITKKGYESCSTTMLPLHTICLTSRAPIGLIGISKVELCTNQGFKNIIVNDKKCFYEYLYYFLTLRKNDLQALGSGTKFKELNTITLTQYQVSLPPLPIQENIAQILSTLDKKIELNTRINAELESMAKLLYTRYFLEYNFPDSSGKPYKASGGAMVYSPTLKREIPKDWEVIKLANRFNFERGEEFGTASYKESKVNKHHIKFYRVGDMIDDSKCVYVDSSKENAPLISENDLLVSFDGSVGRVAYGLNGTYSSGIRKITDKHGEICQSGLYFIFTDSHIQHTINQHATGTNIKHAGSAIENLYMPYSKEVFSDFQNKINSMFALMRHTKQESQRLAEWRDYLLPLLMGDQVEVV